VYRAGDARFRRLLMNKLQLTKGELTKIILEEVRRLNEQATPVEMARQEVEERMAQVQTNLSGMDLEDLTKLNNALKGMTDV
jgi:ribosome maturation factor RimP